MKKTAAALLLMTVPALAGAGVLQDTATAGTTTHTKRLVLHEQVSHRVAKYDYVGTDQVRSRATHDIVGYDSFTGHFDPEAKRAVVQAGFSFKGGVVVIRAHFVGDGPKFRGRILSGSGAYSGISGTVHGRDAGHGKTFLTMTYTL